MDIKGNFTALGFSVVDSTNLILGTTVGTKIGTSNTQKLSFYNATPIVQPSNTTDLRQALINLGLYASGGATPLDLNGGTITANGSALTNLSPANLSGIIPTNKLGTGTANNTTYLRGDGTWQVLTTPSPSITGTGNKAVVTNGSGLLIESSITTSVLEAFPTQISGKLNTSGGAITGNLSISGTLTVGTNSINQNEIQTQLLTADVLEATEIIGSGTGISGITASQISAAPIGAYTNLQDQINTFASRINANSFSAIQQFNAEIKVYSFIEMNNGSNMVLGTTTGTKIGTASTQKLGFYNATPIVQPSSTTDLRQALINLGLYGSGGATPLDLNGGTFSTTSVVKIGYQTPGNVAQLNIIGENSADGVVYIGGGSGATKAELRLGNRDNTNGSTYGIWRFDNGNNDFLIWNTYASGDFGLGAGGRSKDLFIHRSGRILINKSGTGDDGSTTLQINGSLSSTSASVSGTLTTGLLSMTDAGNIVLGTVTGTKIGTASTQKLGFYNATPIVQPSSTTDLRQALINLGLYGSGGATPLNLNGGDITAKKYVNSVVTVTYASSTTINPTLGNIFKITLSGNITLSISNGGFDGDTIRIRLIQDGTGGRTLTMGGTNIGYTTDLPSSALVLSTGANKIDFIGFEWNGSKWILMALNRGA